MENIPLCAIIYVLLYTINGAFEDRKMNRKLFCQISPLTYKISILKEYLKIDILDLIRNIKFAKSKVTEPFPIIVKSHRSKILRELNGVDLGLQVNKQNNLLIAGKKINHIVVMPGETFSFWKLIGRPTQKSGYLNGLAISSGNLSTSIGGGLCQLANLIHWLVLHSPLEVTMLFHHSDAIFPDSQRRVPFGTGTSVFYKHIDYRFKNTTNQPIQLLIWQSEGDLCGELRTTDKFPHRYKIEERDSGFIKENEEYYRVSKVYKLTIDNNNKTISENLILDNHSKVLYDYSLIPRDQILM